MRIIILVLFFFSCAERRHPVEIINNKEYTAITSLTEVNDSVPLISQYGIVGYFYTYRGFIPVKGKWEPIQFISHRRLTYKDLDMNEIKLIGIKEPTFIVKWN